MNTTNFTVVAVLKSFPVLWKFTDVTQLVIGIIGFIGNSGICIVVPSIKFLRTKSNYFIASLAFADCLASVSTIIKIVVIRYPIPSNVMRSLYCKFILSDFLFWTTVTSSVLHLLVITIERYFAIVYPFRYQLHFTTPKAFVLIVISWLIAFLANTFAPIIYEFVGDSCVMVWPSLAYMQFSGVAIFLTTYFVPILLTCYAYNAMFKQINVVNATSQIPVDVEKVRARRNLLKMLSVVVAAFFICWTPNQWIFFAANCGAPIDFESWYYEGSALFAITNSCINPFIYAFRSRQFRRGFRVLLCRVSAVDVAGST
ncbi:substance-P receptor-like [Glandiceps talaboti]